ncbi:MAG: hypothetical protein WCK09_03835 [Bacteroidota bacterium]
MKTIEYISSQLDDIFGECDFFLQGCIDCQQQKKKNSVTVGAHPVKNSNCGFLFCYFDGFMTDFMAEIEEKFHEIISQVSYEDLDNFFDESERRLNKIIGLIAKLKVIVNERNAIKPDVVIMN